MQLRNGVPTGDADARVLRPAPSGFDYAVMLGGFAVAVYGLWRLMPRPRSLRSALASAVF